MELAAQIEQTIKNGENNVIEYKSAKGGFPLSFWETFSAFANTDGGTIILGVCEKKGKFTPDGLTAEQCTRYRKKFWDDAHDKSCVSIPLLMEDDVRELVTEGGNHILTFNIPRAPYNLRPVFLRSSPLGGNTYRRCHEGDYACSDDEVRQMIADAGNMQHSADARILRGYTIDDIDGNTLQRYRRAYNFRHEGHPWCDESDMCFLEHIGAYRKDRASSTEGFTVAGMLMFGKNNSITDPECCPFFFADYREHLDADGSSRWSDRIFPDGTWEANLYMFFTRVLPLMQHALPLPFHLDAQQQRIDTTTAHTAVREALANCIVHCSYSSMGNITIDRYSDRIVMSNPGTMLVSVNEFLEGGHSVCRNPLLQKMFVFIGIGEKGGSGADVIAKGWRDSGWTVMPVIKEHMQPDRVEMTMPIPARYGALPQGMQHSVGEPDDKPMIRVIKEDDVKLTIGERCKRKILRFVAEHPCCRTADIADYTGLRLTQTKNYLYRLLEEEKIVAHGANRNRTYSAKD